MAKVRDRADDDHEPRAKAVYLPSLKHGVLDFTAWNNKTARLGCISALVKARRARKYSLERRNCESRLYFCPSEGAASVKIQPGTAKL